VSSNNPPRDLDAIAADFHRLERSTVFEKGALLDEAREACEHGDWLAWLDSEFDLAERSAQNYVAAHRLRAKYATLRICRSPRASSTTSRATSTARTCRPSSPR
jgi:hypothetical protein